MLYVTGDTHRMVHFQKIKNFIAENKNLNRDDFLIICGDFGGVWDKNTLIEDLKPYEELPFMVLFVDGNHENFDLLNQYPIKDWNNGKVHQISENIIHLMRGQVYTINDKKIFTFGGATSSDKQYRINHVTWWENEVPNFDDYDEAIKNLKLYNYKVDLIITHSCDEKSLYYQPLVTLDKAKKVYEENQLLSNFEQIIDYDHWYFGHYHIDGDINEKKTAVFNNIIAIK